MTDADAEERRRLLETEIERRLAERFAALRDEFDRLRLETDRRWFGFLEKFDQDFKGVVPAELLRAGTPEGAPRPPGSVSIVAARGLDQAATQVDVLHRFLDECRRHCSRAALLVSRGGAIGAWKAVGFSAHGGEDDVVRQISMPLTDGGLLSKVMTGTAMRLPASNEISTLLRASKVSDAIAIPMVVREKISGALYADVVLGEEEIFDADALGFLTFLAGLVVDRLAARKLKPAPALRLPEAFKKPEPAGMWMNEEAAVEDLPTTPEVGSETGPALSEPSAEGPRPHFKEQAPAAPEPEPSLSLSEPPALEAPESARRLSGPLSQPPGDERREEARRFARLLVSEIKLYNERAVLEGREGGNLYQRLKEDIDRSRQMYDERIPEDVRSSSNFFHEELVRILADGRAEALGI
ncbi:MAG: hypothetical protein WAU32_05795 [Thermoanaerobaculia bacterium]